MQDITIVGAGIVGLATALSLSESRPQLKITLLEKERRVAQHQTGHNSGVIHAGIYYKPGTWRAKLCVEGAQRMMQFCETHAIPYERVGKLIVATSDDEVPRLDELHRRAQANNVPGVNRIPQEDIAEIEPHASGVAALHSPNTAIVDYRVVSEKMRELLESRGVQIEFVREVRAITSNPDQTLTLHTPQAQFNTRYLVNCAGLYSDTIVRMMHLKTNMRIVPFRGEYYMIRPERGSLVRGLIYPVPDPQFPFLGVHFTRTVHGEVEAGPNAVFAFAKEGYGYRNIHLGELLSSLSYGGFQRMALQWWRTGVFEYQRSLSKLKFVESLQKLVPDIRADDIHRGGAGVRALAVSDDGKIVDDFQFVESPNSLHVLNAPSPAATASLSIGDHIASRIPAM